MIDWNDNKLTPEIRSKLKQGAKVKFMWHGNSELEYKGRIEVNNNGTLFFVPEHCYDGRLLLLDEMRFYTRLSEFFHFTKFEIL